MRPLLLPAALALFIPAEAAAFNCTTIPDSGVSQAWLSRCIPYAISCQNDTLIDPEIEEIIHASFRRWQGVTCSDMTFNPVGYAPELERFRVQAPKDNFNTIGAADDERVFPDGALLALTFTHFAVDTGEILDADIILNAARFDFVDVQKLQACDRRGNVFDLENTLVHEIGHLIGFDHVLDMTATMFASAEACETEKRDLALDDQNAICAVYPIGAGPSTCSPPQIGYDDGPLDATPFRDQCEAFEGNSRTSFNLMTCRENRGGGCRCVAPTHGPDAAWSILALGALVLLARRRR